MTKLNCGLPDAAVRSRAGQKLAVLLTAILLGMTAASAQTPKAENTASSSQPLARYSSWSTPIGVLMADPAARAVVDKHIPNFSQGAMLNMARAMTFRSIQGYAPGVFTEQVLSAIDADLARLTPIPPPAWAANIRTPNFDENRVPPYVLPPILTLANGEQVRDAATWWDKRRPEIFHLYETQVYGRAPARPAEERFEVFDTGTVALDGIAIRKQVIIHLSQKPNAPTIQVVEYLPAAAHRPVPMMLMLAFGAPVDDPGARPFAPIRTGMAVPTDAASQAAAAQMKTAMSKGGAGMANVPAAQFLKAGIGIAAINYTDIDPDFEGGYAQGIRGFLDGGTSATRAPDAWGALAAWAWALSRVQDYFETDPSVDARRVAIWGASRTGKAALWAAAADQRFAAVIACCSGEVGASLLHRNFGKTFAIDTAPDTPFWTARNFAQYYGHPEKLPVDSHMLLALIAPRPVLLQRGDADLAGDPHGEFLAEVAASPVYKLLGAHGLGTTQWPPHKPILNDLGYVMHHGGHGVLAEDWEVYLEFLKRHLHPATPH